ncbi:Coenzyme F420 hydrogenase/dehydrogenase, beta subunit C-terminal domain [Dyadobacter sp. CY323]|uniref:Coenzyme F420 hydrogenase/dehydrogenase, beta subunit C-terminal domain n=1 Tax=Dyadobacter sp. CY323 TaxID=2907302 RepID=UPI001F41A18C|nr:Coenzyme F420 hydrogenase/dehydrogenase, beta subunit C-terminal domain [Dyadobacter sp. CY323]MCE6992759.1 Coenzyme F420 hydrogenase/dehydrogenase, beta subunit C-terminal domain [Dyadobacter sp. CY323]
MMNSSVIEKIDKLGLCLGCGLCESVCGKDAVEMELREDGFIHPKIKKVIPEKEAIINRICPGTNVINDIDFEPNESVWGHVDKLWSGFVTDTEVRTKGSSGGIVSALGIYALRTGLVDGVMQVGGDANDYERNSLRVSYTREDVVKCASSRYAPAHIFTEIFNILDKDKQTYLFIGKPCDISALKNFLNEFPQYKDRFKLTVSIICAGMPSFNGTAAIINEFDAEYPVKDLVYRGNGWPGYFSFKDKKEKLYRKTYNDSWGKVLNRHLKLRCKLCPDGIGIQADIAVGDAWETTDGYPDFAEKDGQSLIISRTSVGSTILRQAESDQFVVLADLAVAKIKLMQPYQFNRRTRLGARLFAFYLRKGVSLNYKNLAIYGNMSYSKPISLLKEFKGTYTRLKKRRNA